MTDDLGKKLKALTEAVQHKAGAMVLGPSDAPSTMANLLYSIDNTILPCQIAFSVGNSSVSVKAGGRRLRACVEASADLNASSEVMDKMLSSDDTDLVSEIGKLLKTLLIQDGTLMMRRIAEPSSMGQSDAGVGVKTLAGLWGVDLDAVPPTLFEMFESALGDTFIASIETDGIARTGARGDTGTSDVLERDILPKLMQLEADLAPVKTPREIPYLMTLNSALPNGALVSLFVGEGSKSLVASAPGSLPAVAGAWGRV